MSHYNVYHEANITMHKRTISAKEAERLTQKLGDGPGSHGGSSNIPISQFFQLIPKVEKYTQAGLFDKIVHFIVETDQVSIQLPIHCPVCTSYLLWTGPLSCRSSIIPRLDDIWLKYFQLRYLSLHQGCNNSCRMCTRITARARQWVTGQDLGLYTCLLISTAVQACPRKVSLTFDGWTSKVMTAYLAVTAHYFTID